MTKVKFEKPHLKKIMLSVALLGLMAFLHHQTLPALYGVGQIFAPGILLGLALVIPNLQDIDGHGKRFLALIYVPFLLTLSLPLALVVSIPLTTLAAYTESLEVVVAAIGALAALGCMATFNLFFNRRVHIANYLLTVLFGAAAPLLAIPLKQGLSLWGVGVYFWLALVGLGISLTFRSEKLDSPLL